MWNNGRALIGRREISARSYRKSGSRCGDQARRREERAWREWRDRAPQSRALSTVVSRGRRTTEPRPNHRSSSEFVFLSSSFFYHTICGDDIPPFSLRFFPSHSTSLAFQFFFFFNCFLFFCDIPVRFSWAYYWTPVIPLFFCIKWILLYFNISQPPTEELVLFFSSIFRSSTCFHWWARASLGPCPTIG